MLSNELVFAAETLPLPAAGEAEAPSMLPDTAFGLKQPSLLPDFEAALDSALEAIDGASITLTFLTEPGDTALPGADGDTDDLLGEATAHLWTAAQAMLDDFISRPDSDSALALTFGEAETTTNAQDLLQDLIAGKASPPVVILPMAELMAQGAYAADTDTIFLAQELFGPPDTWRIDQPEHLLRVFVEELGHFIDDQLNLVDTPGDEGALFAAQVWGETLSAAALHDLQTENDTTTLTVDGQTFQIEQADLGPGTFTVAANGQLAIEFLADSGAYRGQLAVFSLEGMDGIAPGSPAFIQEAARRALSNSPEGYIVIDDAAEAARLTGELGEKNRNGGEVAGAKGITFPGGTRVAVMLVPNGSVQAVFDNPTAEGSLRPLFSVASANPAGRVHIGEIRPGVFAMEDVRFDGRSDGDFNDVIFQLQGATGQIEAIANLIGTQQIWLDTPLGQQLFLVSDNPLAPPGFIAADNPIFPPVDAAALQVSIPTGVPKFNAGNSEAEIAATGAARITFGTQTVYIGTNQVSANNQNPIVASFDSANPANNWIRTDYEVTGTDGRGLGIAWDGNSLYGVFTVDGTQGSPTQDFRRAANDAEQAWLRNYGQGGGAKVSVLGRINPANGELLDAAYLSAVLNNGNSNTLSVTNVGTNTSGNLVITAESFFSPRRPAGSALTPPTPPGSSPFAYTVEITPDLKRVVSTASPGWT
ncbi:MAG: DUF4114 domain-containing protein [Cyanobacteria bacterium P01_D01_bin.115]